MERPVPGAFIEPGAAAPCRFRDCVRVATGVCWVFTAFLARALPKKALTLSSYRVPSTNFSMKSLRLLLPLLFISAFRLGAAAVESTITAVTVYADRAVVTRTATVELAAGAGEVVFHQLPAGLHDQSLQVSGRGTAQATILDVTARRTFTDVTPNERFKALEDQLNALNKQMRGLDDRSRLLDLRQASLDRMEAALFAPPAKDIPRADLDQMSASLTYLSEQRAKIAADRATLDEEREQLSAKIQAAQMQLNELRGGGRRAVKTVVVRVAAAQAGRLDVSLSYTVGGASWVPNYDARVTSGERSVQLGYFGLVQQNTGEDWRDVQLTLSTARPGLGGAAPKLEPWSLEVFVPRPTASDVRLEAFEVQSRHAKARGPAPTAAPMMDMAAGAPPAEEKEALLAQATVEAGATSATFRIATAASIPSDNTPQKVPITTTPLNAQPEYATTPKRQTVAFLTSKVFNNSEYPLLPGAMNVFLDGTFVATSRLQTVMPGERFDLALGADEGISVKHKRVNRFVEQTGLTNSGTRITYEYLITIQNNKRTAERVVVTDQVPLSRHEKIVVKQLTPPVGEVKPDHEGLLKWTLDLRPAEKRELTVKFTVEHPNDVNVTGLE